MRSLLSLICAIAAVFATSGCSESFAASDMFDGLGPVAYVDPPIEPRSTWAEKILPEGQIPDRGFLVAYFDRSQSSPMFHTEEVDSIAVKYAWSDLHNIKSENFAAYWVGQVAVEEGGKKTIAVNQGRGQSRIFVDGEQVYPVQGGNRRGEFTHYFAPGNHLIEVEYINNWHTTEYKVTISDEQSAPLSDQELREQLASVSGGEIVYVSIYESDNRDTSVEVTLPRYNEPVTIWLDSYEGIDWSINAPGGVAAIVIGSYSPGSRVVGGSDAPVFRSQSRIGIRDRGSSGGCSCSSGHFHCEQRDGIGRLEEILRQKTGKALIGFASDYSVSSITVDRFGQSDRDRARQTAQNIEEARRTCVADANPNFDTMFDTPPPAPPASSTSGWGADTPR